MSRDIDREVRGEVNQDGEVFCTGCGSTTFKYEESHPSERKQVSNGDRALVFRSEFEWFDGDDDPGVVCDGCGGAIILPDGIEVDFS